MPATPKAQAKVAQAEAALKEVEERIQADPKTAQAEAIQARADEVSKKAEAMRDEAWGLQSSANAMHQEVAASHDRQGAIDDLRAAQEAFKAALADDDEERLLAERAAWVATDRRVKSHEDFIDFCRIGLPGLNARRFTSGSSPPAPLSQAREERSGKPKVPDPARSKAEDATTKAGRFIIRTAEVAQGYGKNRHWVAFDWAGRAVAVMPATKYGHASGPDGLDLKRADKPDEDALVWPRSSHSEPPKLRFAHALERAFPEVARAPVATPPAVA